MTADSVPAPMVQVPADRLEELREAVGEWNICRAARALVDAADTPRDEPCDQPPVPDDAVTIDCGNPKCGWKFVVPAPVAPPETVCECNTGMACPVPAHWEESKPPRCRYDAAEDYCDSCDRPYRCARVPVNDEAEAEEAAWHEWNRWGESVTQTPMIREAHRAGFRAARGENA